MATTLRSFLFDQLWARGVRHIFGIPGDFVLNLYEALERDGRFGLVRLSHEPAVGFAADGSARITGGLGVCCVTYDAGGLNMVNIVGVEVHRFQLRDQVVRLAERLGVPVASSFLGRGVFPTRHLQFAGTYLGWSGSPRAT